jgi:hypothetical protein
VLLFLLSKMKIASIILAAIILLFSHACSPQVDEIADLSERVAKLNIHRNDYILGKALTDKQKKTAQRNALDEASPGTYKFKDSDLYVVADRASDRVLVIYERYEQASRQKIRELVGALFFDFGDPTIMAHDKIIYWAFDEKGKISEEVYRKAKKEGQPRKAIAIVKLDSSQKIMDKGGSLEKGRVYYIISSEPILKLHQAQNS